MSFLYPNHLSLFNFFSGNSPRRWSRTSIIQRNTVTLVHTATVYLENRPTSSTVSRVCWLCTGCAALMISRCSCHMFADVCRKCGPFSHVVQACSSASDNPREGSSVWSIFPCCASLQLGKWQPPRRNIHNFLTDILAGWEYSDNFLLFPAFIEYVVVYSIKAGKRRKLSEHPQCSSVMGRNANHDVQLDLEFRWFGLTRMCRIVFLPCYPREGINRIRPERGALHDLRWAFLHCVSQSRRQHRGLFKEVRGSFAILFWLPCATRHRVMTHTHHTHFDRRTLFFAIRHQGRSEVSWGCLLHASGLSFGFQARSTGS